MGLWKQKFPHGQKNQGPQGSYDSLSKIDTTTSFNIANRLIFNTVKKNLGLD